MSDKRFRIAFSFAGERRDFVAKVAAILARRFSEADVLYDKPLPRSTAAAADEARITP